MRLLRSSLYWGLCPQTPGIYRCSRQNSCVASQLGAAPPNPQDTAGGRRVHRLPAIPAAESALGLRPRIALSSAQVLPEWTTMASPCNNFSANGDYPLNFVSHSRGSLQRECPSPCTPIPYQLPRNYRSSPAAWADLRNNYNPLLGSHVKSFVDRLRHQSEVHEEESHGIAQIFVASIDPGLVLDFGSRC